MLNFVCAISLLLCVAFVLFWVTAPPGYQWRFYTDDHRHEIHKWRGLQWTSAISYETLGGKLFPDGAFRAPPGKRWSTAWQAADELPLGVVIGRAPTGDPRAAPYFRILIPLWLLVAVTALLPALWLWLAVQSWRKRGPGLCSKCGYDVRANEDRCPECGTAIERMAPSARVENA
jgi:hypothetical protein